MHTLKNYQNINKPNFHFGKLEKEEQLMTKVSGRKEVIKIRGQSMTGKTENREKLMKRKSHLLESSIKLINLWPNSSGG